nr:pilus assembly protein TadB [Modestobacter versicolor]
MLCLAGALLAWPSAARAARLAGPPGVPRWPDLGALVGGRAGPALLAAAAGTCGLLLSTAVVAGLAAVCGGAAGRALRQRALARAGERSCRALVEALGALSAELRAGRPLDEATGAAVGSCPDPGTAAVLGPVLRLGEPPPGAAAGESAQALRRLAAAVRLSAQTGCSLAGVVTAVEDDLRARAHAEQELRSAVAGPRASATVLAGLPVLGLLMGSGVGADPWRVLTTTGTGTVLLVLGVALELAGTAWSARLVRRAVQR